MDDVFSGVVTILAALALFVGVVLLMTFPTMWLINWLFTPQVIHSVFGVWSFDFWHALWLSTLASILKSSVSSKKD